jgi:hypothetical protein
MGLSVYSRAISLRRTIPGKTGKILGLVSPGHDRSPRKAANKSANKHSVSKISVEESDISRVLFYRGEPRQGSYLSGMAVTDHLMRYRQWPKPLARDWKKTNHTPANLAPNRGLPSQHLSVLLVRSYRTFAPLPRKRGGIFLWHYPHDRSHWALPSKFWPLGCPDFPQRLTPKRQLPQLPRWLFLSEYSQHWRHGLIFSDSRAVRLAIPGGAG